MLQIQLDDDNNNNTIHHKIILIFEQCLQLGKQLNGFSRANNDKTKILTFDFKVRYHVPNILILFNMMLAIISILFVLIQRRVNDIFKIDSYLNE